MRIGVDFDNTIVRYDRLFHRLAVERALVPGSLPATKQSVRDHLRSRGLEDAWTELQGLAYGPRITEAEVFPGFERFLARCKSMAVEVVIVSHKTRVPYRGEPHDLHAAAYGFLESRGLYSCDGGGSSLQGVYLELTLLEKLQRIGELGCSVFIDDLPEVLREPSFPAGVSKVLFDPAGAHPDDSGYSRFTSWDGCTERLLAMREEGT